MTKRQELIQKVKAREELDRRKRSREYLEDFQKFSEDQIRIITKDTTQGFVPFKMNEAQRLIHDKIEKQRQETGMVRAIILKARQQGISTYCAARSYWRTSNNNHYKTVVMAHDATTSDILFDMTRNIMTHQPEGSKPSTSKANVKEIKFSETESSYRVYTAGSPEAGRGTTPTILHGSEVSFWTHDEKVLAGLFQGVAMVPGTEIILESTANGAQGEFYRLWRDAERGENEFIPIFIPWFLTSEYSLPVPKGFERTHEEDALREEFDLTDEQLYWRRIKVKQSGEAKFRQEYPSTAEEAFLVSGANVFNIDKLNQMVPTKPQSLMEFMSTKGIFENFERGSLEVFKHGHYKDKFIIGADVCGGVQQDFHAAVVMTPEREVVAVYRNHIVDPGSFGDILFYLGRMFNNALLIVESNNHGAATLHQLVEMRYQNLYYETKWNQISKEDKTSPGFRTTPSSKPLLIAGLKRAIEDEDIYIPSNRIIEELKDYIALENGRTEADLGVSR